MNHDSKVYGTYLGPTWGRQDPDGPHVGPMNLAIWERLCRHILCNILHQALIEVKLVNGVFIMMVLHWNENVAILMKFLLLSALNVVKITTSGALTDEKVVKMTYPFQCKQNTYLNMLTSFNNCVTMQIMLGTITKEVRPQLQGLF